MLVNFVYTLVETMFWWARKERTLTSFTFVSINLAPKLFRQLKYTLCLWRWTD